MTSFAWFRGRLALAARLFMLAGTSYFLIATSQPYTDGVQRCAHPDLALTFQVTGTCGPEGNITLTSLKDECAIAVTGAAAVGLPSAGRFSPYADGVVSLAGSLWTLSDYLPESAAPAGGQPDAGPFTVVTDAQAGFGVAPSGSGPAAPSGAAGSHSTPDLRSCSHQPSTTASLSLVCSGGRVVECQSDLSSLQP